MIGQTLGPYHIIDRIGEGGMGVVYRAHDTRLDRDVALKFLPPHLSASEQSRARFLREAQAAAAINHPNICSIIDIREDPQRMFIVMELVDGTTLQSALKGSPLPIDRILHLSMDIARGLRAAHGKGVLHRDIKPANIMIASGGAAKIMDFGLAHRTGATRLTRTGVTMGTAPYMSPEQARGEPLDPRTDIWSFGVVMYEMITGTLPFSGEYEVSVLYSILNENPRPVSSLRADVPADLEWVVTKALEKDPSRRFENADQILDALQSLARRGVAGAGPARAEMKRIAVLPIRNISPDPQDEYFADGMTEELISTLSRIHGMRTIARTSVWPYRNASKPVSEIGRELKVSAVIEGSVRKAGKKLRISVQLIDVASEEPIWSHDYDRELEDVFDIQRDLARCVSDALKVELLAGEDRALDQNRREDLEAYTLYLKGRYCWNKFSEEGLQTAISYYERAIQKDPAYALAYVRMAAAYCVLGVNYRAPLDVYPQAKAALEKAGRIDPTIAEAHVVLGAISLMFDWDWEAAERELGRAIEANPSDAEAHQLYSYYLEVGGKADEALAEIRLARDLDPLSLVINSDVGIRYYFTRQYDLAIEHFQKTLELEPGFSLAHIWLAKTYAACGMHDEAVAESRVYLYMLSGDKARADAIGEAYRTSGIEGALRQYLEELKILGRNRHVSPLEIATLHAQLGERDEAFEWLDRAYAQRSGLMPWLELDPRLDNLRSDSRFNVLLGKMNLAG